MSVIELDRALPARHPDAGVRDDDLVRSSGEAIPSVSVIVPAFNAAEFLSDTLRSALSQDFEPLEVVIVDDGSTDRTPEIVAEFAGRDPRVRTFRQQNAGVAAARNRAIGQARGRYVAPLDADDLWHPAFLRLAVEALERAGPETAVAYAWAVTVDESGLFDRRTLDTVTRPSPTRRDQVAPAMFTSNFIGNASSTVMRRDAVLAAGGYDPSLRARGAEGCEDMKLYTLLATRYDFVVVPRTLVGYRSHRASMSRNACKMLRSRLLTYLDISGACPDLPAAWLRAAGRENSRTVAETIWQYLYRGRLHEARELLSEVLEVRPPLPFLSNPLGQPSELFAALSLAPWRLIIRRLRRRFSPPPRYAPFSALADLGACGKRARSANAGAVPRPVGILARRAGVSDDGGVDAA